MVSAVRLAGGPVSWGVDFADAPGNPPFEQVLDGMVAAGLAALELGPAGYLPTDPDRLGGELGRRGLEAVGAFVFDDLHDPDRRAEVLAATTRARDLASAAGAGILLLIDRPGPERAPSAGRSHAAPRLDAGRWRAMIGLIEEMAEMAREVGLRPVFHPHAGSWVEFEDEIERLIADSEIDLCLDLGHAAFAGIDPVEALARWGPRLAHLHLKDVDPRGLASVRERRLSFWDALSLPVFCPLGDGVVDLAAVAAALEQLGYAGHATIEQDRPPGGGDPVADLRRSVAALAAVGLGAAPTTEGRTG